MFQCSSASRKFLNWSLEPPTYASPLVSVLFSEPKIPQSDKPAAGGGVLHSFQCSSASRKFLNKKMLCCDTADDTFQCSSASRKFLNRNVRVEEPQQRLKFQCSSASRKFLNLLTDRRQCAAPSVSVLFSEPKIPQFFVPLQRLLEYVFVSVLFSEPKIPQLV